MSKSTAMAIEFFISDAGLLSFMTVPVACGLQYVDSLRLNGRSMMAIQNNSILPIEFPEISDVACEALGVIHAEGGQLLVGEFRSQGLHNSYFLNLEIVTS